MLFKTQIAGRHQLECLTQKVREGLREYISNEFSGDANVAPLPPKSCIRVFWDLRMHVSISHAMEQCTPKAKTINAMQAYSEASAVLDSASGLQERLGPAGLGNAFLCHPQALSYFSVLPGHLCCVCVCVCSVAKPCLTLLATSNTIAHQDSLSMGFPRQEYWSGLSFLPPGHLPDPWMEPVSPALQANALLLSRGKLLNRGSSPNHLQSSRFKSMSAP